MMHARPIRPHQIASLRWQSRSMSVAKHVLSRYIAVILARPGSFCSITAAITIVTAVVETTVVVASVVGAVVIAARWAMSARIFIEAHLGFLGVGVLVGSSDHLTNACGRLAVEHGAKLVMV